MDRIISNLGFRSIIFIFIIFLLMVTSTAAWLYLTPDLSKKTPLRAKQVFLWHNNQINAQTIDVNQT